MLTIALLHLELRVGDMARNAALAEAGVAAAAALGAHWAVTPELCLTGYDFTPYIGTEWIAAAGRDPWMLRCREAARKHRITLVLGHPERDEASGKAYNSMFLIGADGAIQGTHRKFNALQGAESWSTRATKTAPLPSHGLRVQFLICADAYTQEPAHSLAAAGAQILISSANWAPNPHGPDGCWERRSLETGLPLFVCNRTGMDRDLDFTPSETVIVHRGRRLLTLQSAHSALVLVQWDTAEQRLLSHSIHPLPAETAP